MKTVTTSKSDLKLFSSYIYYFIKRLGLLSWRIYISPTIKDIYNANAEIEYNVIARCADFSLSKTIAYNNGESRKIALKRIALHECLHLLLAESYVNMDRDKDEKEKIEHTIIRTLENIILSTNGT